MKEWDWSRVIEVLAVMGFIWGVLRYYIKSEMEKAKDALEASFGKKFDRIFRSLNEWRDLKPNLVTDEKCKKMVSECPAHKQAEEVMLAALKKDPLKN